MPTPTPTDRHVVVIGAGPGLGAAVARRFGREGSAVTLVGRRERVLAPLADDLRDRGVAVDVLVTDIGDLPRFRAALEGLGERTAPDVVVYNAGLVVSDDLLTGTEGHLVEALAVDVLGAITTAQVLTPAMRAAGAGTLLVTGGGPALHPDPAHGSLSIGKAALRAAVSVLHEQLAPEGVHVASVTVVGVIAPGTALDPDRLADEFWRLHRQPVGEWEVDTVVDGR